MAGHPCSYRVRAGRTADGPVLLGLRVDPLPGGHITADDLRGIPVRRIAAAAVAAGHVSSADDECADAERGEIDWSRFTQPEKPPLKRPGRPQDHGEDHYAEVAQVARRARAAGFSARHAIAARWTVAYSTADKWMRKARDLGLLSVHTRTSAQQ